MTRGRFITVEGIDGAGKSSHLDFLQERIETRGVKVIRAREPGTTDVGEALRKLVLHVPMAVTTEALVMFASRAELVRHVVEPALAAGQWVLCARFSDATYAYQGAGKGLARETFDALERIAHPGLQPDATFLFDVDPAVACERQRAQSRSPDKFESEAADFFRRVREAYLERAREHPRRVHVIDASGTLDTVRARLAAAFDESLR